MRKWESLFLFHALGPEFYHLKEQIKAMKQSDIDPEKMRSLINGHTVQTVKPSASVVITPSASAAVSSRKRNHEGQSSQSRGQSGQSGQSNKKQQTNHEGQATDKDSGTVSSVKKCIFCKKNGHLEKDCWEKDSSK